MNHEKLAGLMAAGGLFALAGVAAASIYITSVQGFHYLLLQIAGVFS